MAMLEPTTAKGSVQKAKTILFTKYPYQSKKHTNHNIGSNCLLTAAISAVSSSPKYTLSPTNSSE